MKPALPDAQISALKTLKTVYGDTPVVLIGATAIGCYIDMRWRQTFDVDLTVSLSVGALPTRMAGLPGWSRHPKKEHEWRGPGDVIVDIVPAGRDLLAAGELVWPESGNRMSLLGMRLAFEHADVLEVGGVEVAVAPPPVILLLKAVAFMDRPHERERDLADIGYILDEAVSVPDRFTDLVIERGYDIDDAGAFLVGEALGAMARADELAALDMFLAKARDPADRHSTHARMARVGPLAWRRDADLVLARIDAFE